MTVNVNRKLTQVGTWWKVSPDGYGGDVFETPILILCRWEDQFQVIPGTVSTKELVSKATVFVDRDISVGDYLCQNDQTSSVDPTIIAGALKVQMFDRVTDLRGVQILRRARL